MTVTNFNQHINTDYITKLSQVTAEAKENLGFLGKVTVGGEKLGWAIAAIATVGAAVAGVLVVTSSIPVTWPVAFLLTDFVALAGSYGLSFTNAVKTNTLAKTMLNAQKTAETVKDSDARDEELIKLLNKANLGHLNKLCKTDEVKVTYFNTLQQAVLHTFFKKFNNRKLVNKEEGEDEISRSKRNINEMKEYAQSLVKICVNLQAIESIEFEVNSYLNPEGLKVFKRILNEEGFIGKMDAALPPNAEKETEGEGSVGKAKSHQTATPVAQLRSFIKALKHIEEPKKDNDGVDDVSVNE